MAVAPPAVAPAKPAATPVGVAPPSGGEIHINSPASGIESNPTVPPPKAGSAKGRMFSEMRKKAGVPDDATTPPAKPGAAPATPPDPNARPGDSAQPSDDDEGAPPADPRTTPEGKPAEGTAKPPATPPTTPEDRKKVSPWKLVDQFKDRLAKAEARALELEKGVVPEAKRKETEERMAGYEKRIQEMQDDLRYHNAEKYDPEIVKANNEYQGAWKRAVAELSELQITDSATGQPRGVTSEDILDLVNMPLGKAREVAVQVFGDFANDVMAHRKEIKTIFENKMAKLDELKKTGAEREQKAKENYERLANESHQQIRAVWEKETASVLASEKHGKFFKPREGDADWNTRLERGYKLVDEAYAKNAADPNLTPEERATIVRKGVAVRNRAAAFEALRLDHDRIVAKLSEVQKKLDGYESSTPGAGGTVPPGKAPEQSGGAFSRFQTKLRGLAK